MAKMKKRIQVAPVALDDHSARSGRSTDTSSRSSRSRSRIRLRNSSSKFNKRQQQQALFNKRPYMYKTAEQSTRSNIRYLMNKSSYARKDEDNSRGIANNPIHWIDWFDSGLDCLGCGLHSSADHLSSEDSHHGTLSLPDRFGNGMVNSLQREEEMLANTKRHLELLGRDYVQLHEDFFDSLLKEEGDRIIASMASAIVSSQQPRRELKSTGKGNQKSSNSITSENTNLDSQSHMDSTRNTSDHTRTSTKSGPSISSTRTIRLGRKGSFKSLRRKSGSSSNTDSNSLRRNSETRNESNAVPLTNDLSHMDETPAISSNSTRINGKKSSKSALSIRDIMEKTDLESPPSYLHPDCKLQKDKGKGESLGSAISAVGRDPTLTKLRDKMKLIVEVSGELESASIDKNTISTNPSSPSNGGNQSGSFKTMSAGMKRRRGKIALIEHNDRCSTGEEDGSYLIETRSMIEFQLGFLSMQYGLLLRWDAYKSGQIVFVCLRKMCHDSFYTKIPTPPPIMSTSGSTTASVTTAVTSRASVTSSQYPKSIMKNRSQTNMQNGSSPLYDEPNEPPKLIDATKKKPGKAPFVIRSSKGGNHAIYQRGSGSTEVVLVDAPYRIQPPKTFAPSMLSLDVHQLTGLNPKSRWTLILTFDGDTEIAHLKYNHREGVFETSRDGPCQWELSMMQRRATSPLFDFDVATGLEIRLFEQRPKQRLRGVKSGVSGMVGGKSSFSSYVPAGSDPFSLSSPSKPYIIQNQRLIYYTGIGDFPGRSKKLTRSSSENSLGSNASGTSASTTGTGGRNSFRKCTSRLASTMTVPLGGLVCQPSASQTTLWKLTIPFTHNENAEVTLTLMHQSEYAHWLYQELRARRKEEQAISPSSGSGFDLLNCLVPQGNDEDGDGSDTFSDDSDVYCMDWCMYNCCI